MESDGGVMENEIVQNQNAESIELVQQENVDVRSMIYTIRGQEVMLDVDLAKLYGYEVKNLNRQVKRNIERFPEDFMFQLTASELKELWCQNVTANLSAKSRTRPYAFTEQGVYMLATVLKGQVAEQQSIFIIRAFREMRKIISSNMYMLPPSVHRDIELLKEKQTAMGNTLDQVMQYISDGKVDNQKIFFDGQTYDAFAFIINLIESANESIVLIDGYTDVKTLNMLSKKKANVNITMYSFANHKPTDIDIATFNSQYPSLQVKTMHSCHDRYLVLDNEFVYCIGASIKDAGKKSFSITKFEDIDSVRSLVDRLDAEQHT